MGSVLQAVEQRSDDRVIDLRFACGADRLVLTAELMGRHSNLILRAADDRVLAAMKHVTGEMSRHREVVPGAVYVEPPPAPGLHSLWSPSAPAIAEQTARQAGDTLAALRVAFRGLSPLLAQELMARSRRDGWARAWSEVFGAVGREGCPGWLGRGADGKALGAYPVPLASLPDVVFDRRRTMNEAMEEAYAEITCREGLEQSRRSLLGEIGRARRAIGSLRADLSARLAEAARSDEMQAEADSLVAGLHLVLPGAHSVEVPDVHCGGERTRRIALAPELSPQENVRQMYRRARRARQGGAAAAQQLQALDAREAALDDAERRVRGASDEEEIARTRERLCQEQVIRVPWAAETGQQEPYGKRTGLRAHRIRTLVIEGGWTVLIGETSAGNDYLTTRVASPNDLWFHARAVSGSHVVLRTAGHSGPPPEPVILRAALEAARHSAAKHSSLVAVDCTLRKHVRRPRGAAPGAVSYTRERTVHVNPKEDA